MCKFNCSLAIVSAADFVQGLKVKGEISLTCDAWQASNINGYFVVTAHWIKELEPGKWKMEDMIIGLTQLNNAHHGRHLGEALFKVVQQLRIEHQVGHVTCDGASNNITMLEKFTELIESVTTREWDPVQRRIRCLAHVINMGTCKLIDTYSTFSHFDPRDPEAHIPDLTDSPNCDEIGIIQTIAVKEHFSLQHKSLWKRVWTKTTRTTAIVKQLVLNMKVRWSSMLDILTTLFKAKKSDNTFVFALAGDKPNPTKQKKLLALQLTDTEWHRVNLFLNLLAEANVTINPKTKSKREVNSKTGEYNQVDTVFIPKSSLSHIYN
ncbi:unnamed protein product [Mycena citricolor]|uniref:Uncharacterized protein n=1 Tax=Mycena citricolor TaxID=2018698 RepID=A0AAD2K8I6_9AGAR|nr:unnamed protein product [Mycena citricolor]